MTDQQPDRVAIHRAIREYVVTHVVNKLTQCYNVNKHKHNTTQHNTLPRQDTAATGVAA